MNLVKSKGSGKRIKRKATGWKKILLKLMLYNKDVICKMSLHNNRPHNNWIMYQQEGGAASYKQAVESYRRGQGSKL